MCDTHREFIDEFVLKVFAVNALTALARACRIPALDHKALNVAVEHCVVVVVAGTQREEVLHINTRE